MAYGFEDYEQGVEDNISRTVHFSVKPFLASVITLDAIPTDLNHPLSNNAPFGGQTLDAFLRSQGGSRLYSTMLHALYQLKTYQDQLQIEKGAKEELQQIEGLFFLLRSLFKDIRSVSIFSLPGLYFKKDETKEKFRSFFINWSKLSVTDALLVPCGELIKAIYLMCVVLASKKETTSILNDTECEVLLQKLRKKYSAIKTRLNELNSIEDKANGVIQSSNQQKFQQMTVFLEKYEQYQKQKESLMEKKEALYALAFWTAEIKENYAFHFASLFDNNKAFQYYANLLQLEIVYQDWYRFMTTKEGSFFQSCYQFIWGYEPNKTFIDEKIRQTLWRLVKEIEKLPTPCKTLIKNGDENNVCSIENLLVTAKGCFNEKDSLWQQSLNVQLGTLPSLPKPPESCLLLQAQNAFKEASQCDFSSEGSVNILKAKLLTKQNALVEARVALAHFVEHVFTPWLENMTSFCIQPYSAVVKRHVYYLLSQACENYYGDKTALDDKGLLAKLNTWPCYMEEKLNENKRYLNDLEKQIQKGKLTQWLVKLKSLKKERCLQLGKLGKSRYRSLFKKLKGLAISEKKTDDFKQQIEKVAIALDKKRPHYKTKPSHFFRNHLKTLGFFVEVADKEDKPVEKTGLFIQDS